MTQTDKVRYTMFLDWKTQPCQNNYIAQGNLQIHNPNQITNDIFHRSRQQQNLKIYIETKKTQIAEQFWRGKKKNHKNPKNPELEESGFQTTGHTKRSSKNTMILAQK